MDLPIERTKNVETVTELKSESLSFIQVLAQSVANVGPSVGPALGIPVVFAITGNGTWLAYVFATITALLVGYNINQFTKRSASSGSLYTFITNGLGPTAGIIAGWGLVIGYILTGSACLAGFSSYASMLFSSLGIKLPVFAFALLGGLSAAYVAFRDVKLSAKLMLLFEIISTLLILTLFTVVLAHRGFSIDTSQIKLTGVSFSSLKASLVLTFFAFTGFESAAALGAEAKKPLKNIPKALVVSVIIVGFLFVLFSYAEVAGFIGLSTKLNEAQAPLSLLADKNGVPIMGTLITIGALISFWSCMVAVITASSRVIFYMGYHKILPSAVAKVHNKHNTPYKAVLIASFILLSVPVILLALGCGAFDIFGWIGTIATFGFLLAYTLCVIATPVFLYKNNLLKARHIIMAVITIVVLLIPIVGSIYPVPPYPGYIFPIIFLIWVIAGAVYFTIRCKNNPGIKASIEEDIKSINKKIEI